MPDTRSRWLASAALILSCALGFAGLAYEKSSELFIAMSPFHLLFSAIILFWFQNKFKRPFRIFFVSTYFILLSFLILNRFTAFPMGAIGYSDSLGFSFFNVPLILPLLWLMIFYSAGIISARLPLPKILKAVAAAILILLMDMALEPAAETLNWWKWEQNQNLLPVYLTCFLLAFFSMLIFYLSHFRKTNKVAPLLFIIYLSFFTLINLYGTGFIS